MATTKYLVAGGDTGITEASTIDTSAGAADAGKVPSLNSSGKLDSSFLPGGGSAVGTDTIWDAKGDLAVGTASDTASKLTVGTDGAQIFADSAQSTGLRWGPSVISPSQITSDQDNYSPTGWAKCQVARISGDNGFRAITSLSATFDGDIKTLINIGSYPVYFPGEHPDGTAANRINTHEDFILLPKKSMQIIYDGTLSRWEIITERQQQGYSKSLNYEFSPGSATTGDWGAFTFVNSGSGTSSTSTASTTSLPAALTMSTGTTSTGASLCYFSKGVSTYSAFGSAHLSAQWLISIPTLSDGTNTYAINLTLENAPSVLPVNPNTCGIRYSHGVNSGKFMGFSKDNGGTESTVDLGVTVAINTLYLLRVEMDKSRSEVRFYVDNVFSGRVTGNMPNAVVCGSRALIQKSVGVTARTLLVHNMRGFAVYP